jgi:DNA mismatch repair protein MutS
LSSSVADVIVLTGPNAAGKSCYLRQLGLIQILAQCGSYVPAHTATLSLVDDLAGGKSTFVVETSELSVILRTCTRHSLLLLDEIGRGTACVWRTRC